MIFDHIGIFVADISDGDRQLSAMLPITTRSPIFEDPLIQVRVQFLTDRSGICYELVAPFGEQNPVSTVLRSRKNVLNHVAYRVDDIAGSIAALEAEGAMLLGPARPAVAFGGRPVAFLYTAMNFIIELIGEDASG